MCFTPRFGTPHSPSLVVQHWRELMRSFVSPLRASGGTGRRRCEDGIIHRPAEAYMCGSRRGLKTRARAALPSRASSCPLATAFASGKRPLAGHGPEGPREVEPPARHSSPAAGLPRNPPSGTSGTSPPSEARLGLNFDFWEIGHLAYLTSYTGCQPKGSWFARPGRETSLWEALLWYYRS